MGRLCRIDIDVDGRLRARAAAAATGMVVRNGCDLLLALRGAILPASQSVSRSIAATCQLSTRYDDTSFAPIISDFYAA